MSGRIGIMQGRLVPPVDGRIQSFPSGCWREEFSAAQCAGLAGIEWIYDKDSEDGNPIGSDDGIAEMLDLSRSTDVRVDSLCADFFMSDPLLAGRPDERRSRAARFDWLLDRCAAAQISRIVLPFVDGSKLRGDRGFDELFVFLESKLARAADLGIEIHLETSLAPELFALLLRTVNHPSLKVNYDSGNSAALGFDVGAEFAAYGHFIGSIHIKDRRFGGATVPLGQGDSNFGKLARNLRGLPYDGDFILQVARDVPGDEVNWAIRNRGFVEKLIAGDI